MTKRDQVPSRLVAIAALSIAAALLACNSPAQSAATIGAGANPAGQMQTAKVAAPAAAPTMFGLTKPVWLTDLSLRVKGGNVDNLFTVSGDGAKRRTSWIVDRAKRPGFEPGYRQTAI